MVSHLDTALISRAYHDGRGQRTALYRHRRLLQMPLAMVLWQLGAEPFTAAAIGYGRALGDLRLVVPGEPRNRDLAFAAFLSFARWFNPLFEQPNSFGQAPQVLVANLETVDMLGRIGRRLAYLPTAGARPADPALVRLGQHLQFLHRHAVTPGQQLVVPLTDLLGHHWATAQSPLERQSLAALDAYIEPPSGEHGFTAAFRIEDIPVGPLPSGTDDEWLDPRMRAFNDARHSGADQKTLSVFLQPIIAHYQRLVEYTWEVLWRCHARELAYQEAPSVERRWDDDRAAYSWHLDWVAGGGRLRTRQDARGAAMTIRRLETAKAQLETEEALDDPLRMIPFLLEHKAVLGRVMRIDHEHRELVNGRRVLRPRLSLESPDPCDMPHGRELQWTEQTTGKPWVVETIRPSSNGGSTVTLKLLSNRTRRMPTIGANACFSVLSRTRPWPQSLPQQIPWTHRPATPPIVPASIEDINGAGEEA